MCVGGHNPLERNMVVDDDKTVKLRMNAGEAKFATVNAVTRQSVSEESASGDDAAIKSQVSPAVNHQARAPLPGMEPALAVVLVV